MSFTLSFLASLWRFRLVNGVSEIPTVIIMCHVYGGKKKLDELSIKWLSSFVSFVRHNVLLPLAEREKLTGQHTVIIIIPFVVLWHILIISIYKTNKYTMRGHDVELTEFFFYLHLFASLTFSMPMAI